MDPEAPDRLTLRSRSRLTLHERFSQVLLNQVTSPRLVTSDPAQPQQSRTPEPTPPVLLVKCEPQTHQTLDLSERRLVKTRRRKSVWTRLGWSQVTRFTASRPRGFWSFRNKYRVRFSCRRWAHLCRCAVQRRLLTRKNTTNGQTHLGVHLKRGGASAFRGRGRIKQDGPTREQLDQQLEDYMSLSRRRLDAELDQYMLMAGQGGALLGD